MFYAGNAPRRCPLTRPLILALGLLLAGPASAADLELTITSDGVGPATVTLHDIHPGALPSVSLPGQDGHAIRLDLTLSDSTMDGDPSYDLAMHVTRRSLEGRRKVHEDVSDPTVRFRPDHDAEVTIGSQRPIPGSDPAALQLVNFYTVKARIRTVSAAP